MWKRMSNLLLQTHMVLKTHKNNMPRFCGNYHVLSELKWSIAHNCVNYIYLGDDFESWFYLISF